MAEVIRMPLLSDTMKEGVIANWNKKVGDKVRSDDAIADVETDKATMEVIPYVEGVLLYVGVEAGKAAKVNDIIAIIGKEGEDISALIPGANGKNTTQEPEAAKTEVSVVVNNQETKTPEIPKELTLIRMPLLSDTMKEGKIVLWNKQVGDTVKADDSLADVETDKATMEVVGYAEGTLLYQGVNAGEAAQVNAVIAVIGPAGTDITPYISSFNTPIEKEVVAQEATTPIAPAAGQLPVVEHTPNHSGRIKASPLAKSIASQKGIDLSLVKGSGDEGRIVKRDLENWTAPQTQSISSGIAPALSGTESHIDIPVTQMRKIIAQRLGESKFTAPHFYLKISVEMDKLMEIRKQINAVSAIKISINDMIIKASAMSLLQHPDVNSSWMGDFVRKHQHVHIGSAIALEDGLIVPVIKFANQKSLSQIASDANELYEKARAKKIQPQEFTGNTFTISNLGMMEIDEFTAIINPPDACILAVGRIAPTPVVSNGNIVVKNILKLTLSCDHRVVDGAVGARFLQTLKTYLENPVGMLI
ncbi:MAG: 2-oxo acid dehydrogenase subunit E2 [Chitinophagaceae bacterium]|nr:2-oxo acid dehydrogenase subunit E2 [Chitinophagaceae bacterium]